MKKIKLLPEVRQVDCQSYSGCLERAVRMALSGFNCRDCAEYVPEAYRMGSEERPPVVYGPLKTRL